MRLCWLLLRPTKEELSQDIRRPSLSSKRDLGAGLKQAADKSMAVIGSMMHQKPEWAAATHTMIPADLPYPAAVTRSV
jgi:hypothetical protein